MTQEELQEAVHRRPFLPFRVVLTTGETFDIRHPDLIMVGRASAILGITNDPTTTAFDRTFRVDLLHIVGVQDLPVQSPSPNGPAA